MGVRRLGRVVRGEHARVSAGYLYRAYGGESATPMVVTTLPGAKNGLITRRWSIVGRFGTGA